MNGALRHLSVRTWLTAFTGGLASLWLLPWWQQAMGVDGLLIPAVGIMICCFAGAGWGMNRVGLGFLKRHINETAAWERAGMTAEAEAAFSKAMAVFDSFWLSPLSRRGRLPWFSGVMARFYLGQNDAGTFVRERVATHLKHFPEDKEVAEIWMDQLLSHERHLPLEHEAAACVGDCLRQSKRLQRSLMAFYLANGRVDFEALQTYRQVCREADQISERAVCDLAKLLCTEYYLDHWALKVYLKAYYCGDLKVVEGLAAAVRWLPPTESSRADLQLAETILNELGQDSVKALDARFKPELNGALTAKIARSEKTRQRPKPKIDTAGVLRNLAGVGAKCVAAIQAGFSHRRSFYAMGVIVAVLAVGVAGLTIWRAFNQQAVQPKEKPVVAQKKMDKKKIKITDPFTIQVAAYLKSSDAQRYVDQLRQKQLDAFWIAVTNAKRRTWYQVKISHFPDRQGAERYGQELKAKGLIDDFYVANYQHALRNDIKK